MTWRGHCIVCGAELRRRWWQRGLLTPIPLCPVRHARECEHLARALWRI